MTLSARVIRAALELGLSLGAAESLTGGLVTSALVDVPGASGAVRGGLVAYVPEVKTSLLGVPEAVLQEHGTVSPACALAMARGARRVLAADLVVSTTGTAGPGAVLDTGGRTVPAGEVHLALVGTAGGAGETGELDEIALTRRLTLPGTREEVRAAATRAALGLLAEVLSRGSGSSPGYADRDACEIEDDIEHRAHLRTDAEEVDDGPAPT